MLKAFDTEQVFISANNIPHLVFTYSKMCQQYWSKGRPYLVRL